jgi:hypothetical protein
LVVSDAIWQRVLISKVVALDWLRIDKSDRFGKEEGTPRKVE